MRSKILHEIMQDNLVMDYLLKHEQLIVKYFNVPLNSTPKTFIMELANAGAVEYEYPQYHMSPIITNLMAACTLCSSSLRIKKALNASLLGDVLGTLDECMISKHSNSWKVTY